MINNKLPLVNYPLKMTHFGLVYKPYCHFFQGTKVKLNCIFFSMPGKKLFSDIFKQLSR
ncbi:hypothetical protein SAMN05216490_3366 [Mucilaginibacter mallensis]|uniref:Uncharacterized protein n=1 Tax=Mucilaginibacter mallensis TaxID=652787 RepID=A0A1H2A3M3_MUCMA|nr:hypothetical protein SAMN05216490_3366 [Mucilaginibacter mallensis]